MKRWLAAIATLLLAGADVAAAQQDVEREEPSGSFMGRVLGFTEITWKAYFTAHALNHWPAAPAEYSEPTLVLFDEAVVSGCGAQSSARGPFYCPRDRKLYLDISFFRELSAAGAEGDGAQVYAIAHEVGHHVQYLIGVEDWAAAQERLHPGSNYYGLRLELQADCFAGLVFSFANKRGGVLEPGDWDEVVNAARTLGESYPPGVPEAEVLDTFTHGSADQRARWVQRGYDTGDPAQCDTFAAPAL